MSNDIVIDLVVTSPVFEVNLDDVSLEVVVDIIGSGPAGPIGPQGDPGIGGEAISNIDIENMINSLE